MGEAPAPRDVHPWGRRRRRRRRRPLPGEGAGGVGRVADSWGKRRGRRRRWVRGGDGAAIPGASTGEGDGGACVEAAARRRGRWQSVRIRDGGAISSLNELNGQSRTGRSIVKSNDVRQDEFTISPFAGKK